MLTIDISPDAASQFEWREAGTPEAVAGILLWRLMIERRERVVVRVEEGRIEVRDEASGERIGPCDRFDPPEVVDPGKFIEAYDIAAFMQRLRAEAGWLRRRRIRVVPMSACCPRNDAFVTFADVSDNETTLRVQYDIPRWKWRLRRFLWEMGNKFLDR